MTAVIDAMTETAHAAGKHLLDLDRPAPVTTFAGFRAAFDNDTNVLPGVLLAREAGATVTDADGNPWKPGAAGILVSGPALHAPLLTALQPI